MSSAVTSSQPAAELGQAGGTSFGNVLRSEWTKLRSLRSTWWTVLAALVLCIGLSLLIDWAIVANWDQASAQDRATFDPTSNAFNGLSLGVLVVAVLGVLTVSSEFSTGGIKASFIAVPRRLLVIGAKTLVVAVLGLVVGFIISFACFYGGQAIFASRDAETSLGASGVLRAVVGAALYVAGCGMYGLAVGALLRRTAGAITGVVALLFVLPLLARAIPGNLGDRITEYFTTNAGQAVTTTVTLPSVLSPWVGYAVFTVEWLGILVLGAVLLRARDT